MGYFESRDWRFLSFNVENLFLYFDHCFVQDPKSLTKDQWRRMSSALVENKPLEQVLELASAIENTNPDFVLLSEVGGSESLANFSHYFLEDRYVPHLLEGNSDRGIDIGFLVKRGLPFKYDMVSHRNRPLDFQYPHEKQSSETGYRAARSHRFSRDVVELRVFEDEQPVLVLINVHLKSPLDKDRIDPGGRDRRKAECEMLVQIYKEARQETAEQIGAQVGAAKLATGSATVPSAVPFVVGGGFNGVAFGPQRDSEFASLASTDLRCALDIAGVPEQDRFTWCYFYGNRPGVFRQIDYLLVSPELVARVDSHTTWVYRYRDERGANRLAPRNANEKRLLPSDHFPVVLTLTQVPHTSKPSLE